jgi:hypothetical protein
MAYELLLVLMEYNKHYTCVQDVNMFTLLAYTSSLQWGANW